MASSDSLLFICILAISILIAVADTLSGLLLIEYDSFCIIYDVIMSLA